MYYVFKFKKCLISIHGLTDIIQIGNTSRLLVFAVGSVARDEESDYIDGTNQREHISSNVTIKCNIKFTNCSIIRTVLLLI